MFIVDENGNIELIQGDTGTLVVEDLPTDKNYKVFLSVYNSKRQTIGAEISVFSSYSSSVTFVLSASFTDLLTVPKTEDTQEYYYGIKICDTNTQEEDTLSINDGDIGDLNTITVYPKKVEGLS